MQEDVDRPIAVWAATVKLAEEYVRLMRLDPARVVCLSNRSELMVRGRVFSGVLILRGADHVGVEDGLRFATRTAPGQWLDLRHLDAGSDRHACRPCPCAAEHQHCADNCPTTTSRR